MKKWPLAIMENVVQKQKIENRKSIIAGFSSSR
jgi:hypothetical protein